MTFKELQTFVIQKLQENSTPEYWSIDEIKDAINRGYMEFNRLTKFLTERRPAKNVRSGLFTIPDDAIEVLSVYYKGRPLTPIDRRQLDRGFNCLDYVKTNFNEPACFNGYWADNSGEPRFYTIIDGLIKLVPFPENSTEKVLYSSDGFGVLLSDNFGLLLPVSDSEELLLQSEDEFYGGVSYIVSLFPVFVEFVRLPERLVNDTDRPDIPLAYHDALAFYALYELFSREGTTQDLQKASFYYQLFNNLVEQAKNFFVPRTPKLNMPFYL